MRTVAWSLIIILQVIIVYLLFTGSDLLLLPVFRTPIYPLGNFLTWFLFILFPLTVKHFTRLDFQFPYSWTGKVLHYMLHLSLVMGVLWPLVGFFLSENLENTFNSDLRYQDLRSTGFWIYTFLAPGLSLLALLFLLGVRLVRL
jgi:hypothetical protein